MKPYRISSPTLDDSIECAYRIGNAILQQSPLNQTRLYATGPLRGTPGGLEYYKLLQSGSKPVFSVKPRVQENTVEWEVSPNKHLLASDRKRVMHAIEKALPNIK